MVYTLIFPELNHGPKQASLILTLNILTEQPFKGFVNLPIVAGINA